MLRKGSVRENGVELLRYRLELPVDSDEELNELHRQLIQSVERFCREELCMYAHRSFEESDDPQKRFRFSPFFYFLQGKITHTKRMRADVMLEAKLCRRGEEKPLQLARHQYHWYL